MSVKTLEQKRATYSLLSVRALKGISGLDNSKLLSLFRKLPSMIMHNGLITSMAFLKSKALSDGKVKEEGAVLYALIKFLKNRNSSTEIEGVKSDEITKGSLQSLYEDYFNKLLNMSFSRYRLETAEALRIAQWLKRIAEGEIEDESK